MWGQQEQGHQELGLQEEQEQDQQMGKRLRTHQDHCGNWSGDLEARRWESFHLQPPSHLQPPRFRLQVAEKVVVGG
jgi:hypothetical protein